MPQKQNNFNAINCEVLYNMMVIKFNEGDDRLGLLSSAYNSVIVVGYEFV